MQLVPDIDSGHESQHIISFIKNTVVNSGFSDVIIAVSGGVDSALSLILSVQAVGVQRVHVLLLPYGTLNPQGTEDAKLVIEAAGLSHVLVQVINIQPMVDSFDPQGEMDMMRLGNVMARVRMIVLYDMARKHRSLVIGTENRSEYLLGYFTRFGDEASDIEPIRHLYKTQVYKLATYSKVPEKILQKAPTAGLWKDQTDEKEFGFSYEIADQILYGLFELHLSESDLIKKGLEASQIEKVQKWVKKNKFKHEVPQVYRKNASVF